MVSKCADGKADAAIMEWEYEYNQQIKALQKKIAELEEENRRLREQKGETEDERDEGTDNTDDKE